MVRLRLATGNFHTINSDRFQFLYGTIKTKIAKDVGANHETFQFLYGTIKTESECQSLPVWNEFQFLYGTIKTPMMPVNDANSSISIPVWYD